MRRPRWPVAIAAPVGGVRPLAPGGAAVGPRSAVLPSGALRRGLLAWVIAQLCCEVVLRV